MNDNIKMFQVTDNNHTAYLVLGTDGTQALKKIFSKLESEELLNPIFNEDGDSDEEVLPTFEQWCEEWEAYEVDDMILIDNDGPIEFYSND